jgi:inorganic pyrophosphatase
MHLENLSIGSDPPNEVNAVIEVPVGGEPIKYETDKAAGMLVVDRFLYTPMRYPGNYGFIPHTLSEDGDPCDVLVANTRPLMPAAPSRYGQSACSRWWMKAEETRRSLRFPSAASRSATPVHNYTDLPEILWRQIEHFFAHYKDLEPGKWSKFDGWGDAEHAKDLIEQAIARASKLQRVREVVIGLSLLRLPGVGIERARRSRRAACRLSTGNMLRAAAKAAPVEKAEATKAKRSINPR